MLRSAILAVVLFGLFALAHACSRDSNLTRVDRHSEQRPDVREVGWLKDGKKHGQWHYYWEGRLDEIGHWRNGVRDGLDISFWEDGAVMNDLWWRRGQMHGRWRFFQPDGRLTALGWFRSDGKEGV